MAERVLRSKFKDEIISRLDELSEYDLFIILRMVENIKRVRPSIKN
jgi:hypothetical protein